MPRFPLHKLMNYDKDYLLTQEFLYRLLVNLGRHHINIKFDDQCSYFSKYIKLIEIPVEELEKKEIPPFTLIQDGLQEALMGIMSEVMRGSIKDIAITPTRKLIYCFKEGEYFYAYSNEEIQANLILNPDMTFVSLLEYCDETETYKFYLHIGAWLDFGNNRVKVSRENLDN